MRDIAPSRGKPTINKPRARKEAARVLAVNLQARYRVFLESAGDENATVVSSAALAQCMYENVEFILWALKSIGGMNPAPPEELNRIAPSPANDPRFAKPPELKLEETDPSIKNIDLPCVCPPLEHGIIGRDKHMTSCPKYIP